MNTVTFKIVGNSARNNFLYNKVGNALIAVENAVFNTASSICEDYDSGFWEFAELTNGGFFMYPTSETPFSCNAENFAEETVSAEAFGIVCTLYALSHVSFKWKASSVAERIVEAYHSLLEYSRTREDHAQIAALID